MALRGRPTACRKLDYARLLAAALAHLVRGQGDAVGLVVYDSGPAVHRAAGGRAHLRGVLVALSQLAGRRAGRPRRSRCGAPRDLLKRRGLLCRDLGSLRRGRRASKPSCAARCGMGHEVARVSRADPRRDRAAVCRMKPSSKTSSPEPR